MLTFWQDTVHPRGDIGLFIFLLQFFQISTRSLDHSFSAIVLKLDRYTRETGLEQSRQRKMSRTDGGGFDRSIANGTGKVARVTFY